jgi:hypothetical protein
MPALVALANTTLGSNSTTITFSSIPGTYQDLYLVVVGRSSGGFYQNIRFNGDSGANYNVLRFTATGSTIASGVAAAATRGLISDASFNSSITGAAFIHILDYARTDKHKTTIGDVHADSGYSNEMICNRWANTAAITSVALSSDSSQTYLAGTTFALYGVRGS